MNRIILSMAAMAVGFALVGAPLALAQSNMNGGAMGQTDGMAKKKDDAMSKGSGMSSGTMSGGATSGGMASEGTGTGGMSKDGMQK